MWGWGRRIIYGLQLMFKALVRNERMDDSKTHEGSLIGTVTGDC